jgi:hypothetical protein
LAVYRLSLHFWRNFEASEVIRFRVDIFFAKKGTLSVFDYEFENINRQHLHYKLKG